MARKSTLCAYHSEVAIELAEFVRGSGVRTDWHEPDEAGVTAKVTGKDFDNAGSDRELIVTLKGPYNRTLRVNLADLLALATETGLQELAKGRK